MIHIPKNRIHRYLKLKTHIPTDIDFTVSDTFESLRPKMERAATLEAADALIAKLTPETGAKHVYGIDALEVKEEGSDGAGAGGGGGEDDDSEGSESDDDEDNKDKGDRRAKNLLSDMWELEHARTPSLSVVDTCSRPWHDSF